MHKLATQVKLNSDHTLPVFTQVEWIAAAVGKGGVTCYIYIYVQASSL